MACAECPTHLTVYLEGAQLLSAPSRLVFEPSDYRGVASKQRSQSRLTYAHKAVEGPWHPARPSNERRPANPWLTAMPVMREPCRPPGPRIPIP